MIEAFRLHQRECLLPWMVSGNWTQQPANSAETAAAATSLQSLQLHVVLLVLVGLVTEDLGWNWGHH